MKRIKIFTALFLAFVLTCLSYVTAFAYTFEQYAYEAPGGTVDTWVSSEARDMVASTSTVKGTDVGFYYKPSTLKTLPEGFYASEQRSFKLILMEEDVFADDEVKEYKGTFDGRKLALIEHVDNITEGTIESTYRVELYIKQFVGSLAKDTETVYTTLFSYYFGII